MKERILKNRNLINLLILILITLVIGMPLLNSKLNVFYDDGIQHIARAYGTYESILESGIFTKVISSFSNSFGYSWDLFYGPLTTYSIIVLKFICNNFLSAYKLFAFLCLFASGYTMYKCMLSVTKNNNSAILSAILYMSFPYHLTDLYTRNAIRGIYFIYFYSVSIFRFI